MLIPYWIGLIFVLGLVVGSFLNVAIARLPEEKSLLWPSSRCGKCLQRIQWFDNIPLLSYLWLGGKCRVCNESFSSRYFFVELLTGLGFAGLFYLEIVRNHHGWPIPSYSRGGQYPWQIWVSFGWHALLLSLLMVASLCDLQSREIPLSLTLFGTAVGIAGSAFLAWPFPQMRAEPYTFGQFGDPHPQLWALSPTITQGLYPWPFWGPLPEWARPGSWQLGLMTGVCGALMGTFLLRAIGFLFSTGLGKEALGMGDADLMMMVGAFVGWQVVVVAFFLSVFPALIIGICNLAVNRDNSLPFGPSLALGSMGALLGWQWIGPYVQPLLFTPMLLGGLAVGGSVFIVLATLVMNMLRGMRA